MSDVTKKHAVFVLFSIGLIWLMLASATAFHFGGGKLIVAVWIAVVLILATVTYRIVVANRAAASLFVHLPKLLPLSAVIGGFSLLYIAIVITHFLILGYVPIIRSLKLHSEIDISLIRQNGYFGLPGWMRYASDYALKSIGPVLLVLTYHFRSRWFFLVATAGIIYTSGLMARSLPLILLLPLLVYLLLLRRFAHAIAVGVLAGALLMFLTVAAVPQFRVESLGIGREPPITETDQTEGEQLSSENSRILTIVERIAVVPGRVMAQWYDYYSAPDRREGGCGYRVVSAVISCSAYVHIPSKLYLINYPERVEAGMHGSLNAAYLMTDFANFGYLGFVLSGISAGLLFGLSRLVYGATPVAVALNVPLVISLMETNLLIAVNSGSGWLVTTLIYVLTFHLTKLKTYGKFHEA